jgi:hypothetical protein
MSSNLRCLAGDDEQAAVLACVETSNSETDRSQ